MKISVSLKRELDFQGLAVSVFLYFWLFFGEWFMEGFGDGFFCDLVMDFGSILAPEIDEKRDRFRDRFLNSSKIGLLSLGQRSLASQASPKDTILVSFWTPELESSGPEDPEPGTGTGAWDLTRRGPVARRIVVFDLCIIVFL